MDELEPSSAEPVERIRIALRVDSQRAGLRADQFLVSKIPRLSRAKAQRIIASGDLRRGELSLDAASRVKLGEELSLWRTPPAEPDAPSTFAVLADDGDLIAIDKPAGLVVHPSARYYRNTLTQLLRRDGAPFSHDGPPPRPCHRLDRETSGVLLLARSLDTERRVKEAFANGTVHKTYWALVEGVPAEERFVVDVPLGPTASEIKIKQGPGPDAKPARTRFEVLRRLGARALLACHPETGRTHQIRAHLALRGHPIVGDKIYGSQGDGWFLRWAAGGDDEALLAELDWPRHCLHARELVVEADRKHPELRFEAPWAGDLPPVEG